MSTIHRTPRFAIASLAALGLFVARAGAEPATSSASTDGAPAAITAGANPAAAASPAAAGARWRMVRHEGRWWYWHPNRTWSLYRDGQWLAYSSLTLGQTPAGASSTGSGTAGATRYQSGYRGVAPATSAAPAMNTAPFTSRQGYGGQGNGGGYVPRYREPSGGANGQPNDPFITGGR